MVVGRAGTSDRAGTSEQVGWTSPPVTAPILTARGLSCRFGDLTVLRDVDLDLVPGELVALVGENGAGKSTLVRCLVGALAPRPVRSCSRGGRGATRPTCPAPGVAVVWQDLALCDNLDVVANLFLGQEWGAPLLSDADMFAEARRVLSDLAIDVPDLSRPVGLLSGGQRQMIAVARAFVTRPRALLLDEPTAALGVTETRHVNDLLKRLREPASRSCWCRTGSIRSSSSPTASWCCAAVGWCADVSPLEVHPDDVVDLMAGIETDSTARKQLHRLHSLVDQLSEVEPSASLPLIVSAIANALGQGQVCVHLLEPLDEQGTPGPGPAGGGEPARTDAGGDRAAAPRPGGGPVGVAAAGRARHRRRPPDPVGPPRTWPVPRSRPGWFGLVGAHVGGGGVLGVVSGWSPARGACRASSRSSSPSTPATPRPPSSGSGCWPSCDGATASSRRCAASSRRWPALSRSGAGSRSPCSPWPGASAPRRSALYVQADGEAECRAEVHLGAEAEGTAAIGEALAAAVEVVLDCAGPAGSGAAGGG